MLVIFKTGGKQYSAKAGQTLKVEKLEGKKGDNISFKDVLAISDTAEIKIGTPMLKGAVVEAKILEQTRDKKIIVFKKRRRQNYRSTQGQRRYLTVLKIESISLDNKKLSTDKKEVSTTKKTKKLTTKTTGEIKKTTSKKTTPVKKVVKKNVIKKNLKKTQKKDK